MPCCRYRVLRSSSRFIPDKEYLQCLVSRLTFPWLTCLWSEYIIDNRMTLEMSTGLVVVEAIDDIAGLSMSIEYRLKGHWLQVSGWADDCDQFVSSEARPFLRHFRRPCVWKITYRTASLLVRRLLLWSQRNANRVVVHYKDDVSTWLC